MDCDLLLCRRLAAKFVTLGLQVIDLLHLICDRCGLISVPIPLEIAAGRAGDDASDHDQPDTRIDPAHATSPPAA
ncbi:hypothetical protein WJ33_23250 [Burkholderia ubonensis]|uniref:Uncharacterized protein n=1 Tax=Burkholderia ubonensis TaxID=101571 RepID=A0A103RK07_9BURK|nr:hypothetical protein WJ33_23250 [Burkholderia ubonensis]